MNAARVSRSHSSKGETVTVYYQYTADVCCMCGSYGLSGCKQVIYQACIAPYDVRGCLAHLQGPYQQQPERDAAQGVGRHACCGRPVSTPCLPVSLPHRCTVWPSGIRMERREQWCWAMKHISDSRTHASIWAAPLCCTGHGAKTVGMTIAACRYAGKRRWAPQALQVPQYPRRSNLNCSSWWIPKHTWHQCLQSVHHKCSMAT
jgi:hypothetical protein